MAGWRVGRQRQTNRPRFVVHADDLHTVRNQNILSPSLHFFREGPKIVEEGPKTVEFGSPEQDGSSRLTIE